MQSMHNTHTRTHTLKLTWYLAKGNSAIFQLSWFLCPVAALITVHTGPTRYPELPSTTQCYREYPVYRERYPYCTAASSRMSMFGAYSKRLTNSQNKLSIWWYVISLFEDSCQRSAFITPCMCVSLLKSQDHIIKINLKRVSARQCRKCCCLYKGVSFAVDAAFDCKLWMNCWSTLKAVSSAYKAEILTANEVLFKTELFPRYTYL